jgi:UDP-N-acetylglucosamine--N-acetylmuramyl-(pentapeptide) pyrophosphoryl-undecaprenol N-acetylglucosamine transferase
LDQAVRKGIPTLIQEQNSFPGITNRLLAQRVDRICAGLPGLDRWFPKDRIVQTGNPLRAHVRELMDEASPDLEAARGHWGLPNEGPMVFIMGGSLGAQSMNEAVQNILSRKPRLSERGYQILWQCGTRYFDACQAWLNAHPCDGVICKGFIDRMDLAYQAADLIASRAGAMSIAELALVGKPSILVPSPHVAEDHQTHNARSLTELGGALLLRDDQVQTQLGHHLQSLIADRPKCEAMGTAMRQAARPQAASDVVDELEKLVA